jgi:hypothetical protein
MIKDCLTAAGISKIVWIDDSFAPPSREQSAANIYEHLKRLKNSEQKTLSLLGDVVLDLTLSIRDLEDQCAEALEGMNDAEIAEADTKLTAISGFFGGEGENLTDLTPEEFATLKRAFGSGLKTYSLKEWTSVGEKEFAEPTQDTLFLIDKEFGRENTGFDGSEILVRLVDSPAFCVMLSYTCKEDEQESRRVDLANTRKLPAHKFCFLSKQQSGDDIPIDRRFERAIYTVMTHRFTGEIAEALRLSIQESASETAKLLTRQSVFEIDQAIFANSQREGVPEFDVLLRIFNIEQRDAVNRSLKRNSVQEKIRQARRFRKSTGQLRAQWPAMSSDLAAFRDWRSKEIFEDGAGLNSLHAPLTCGDIFESAEDASKRFVLIAQPCDLMVRGDSGKRRASVGIFARVIEQDTSLPASGEQAKDSNGRFYEIKGVFGPNRIWRVDFQNTTSVDLFVLDMAVFDPNGVVQLSKDQPEPLMAVPEGWQKRFAKAKAKVFGGSSNAPTIGMGTDAQFIEGQGDLTKVKYPLIRVGRLNNSIAIAILAAWATFQTRAALEHDFAEPVRIKAEGNQSGRD